MPTTPHCPISYKKKLPHSAEYTDTVWEELAVCTEQKGNEKMTEFLFFNMQKVYTSFIYNKIETVEFYIDVPRTKHTRGV